MIIKKFVLSTLIVVSTHAGVSPTMASGHATVSTSVESVSVFASATTPKRGVIDIRNQTPREPSFLIITQRSSKNVAGWPGHAFVALAGEDSSSRVCYERRFGLYAKSDAKGVLSYVFGPVDGVVTVMPEDREEKLIEHQVVIKITMEQRDAIRRLIAEVSKAPSYQLGSDDCVTFVEKVLRSLVDPSNELVVPKRPPNATPESYLKAFIKANNRLIKTWSV